MPENNQNTRDKPNGFNPKSSGAEYTYLNEKEKVLVRNAFNAGRDFEAELFKEVLETILLAVKKYRAKTTAETGEGKATENT